VYVEVVGDYNESAGKLLTYYDRFAHSGNLRATVPFACAHPLTDLIHSTACKLLHSVPSGLLMTAVNVTAHASF